MKMLIVQELFRKSTKQTNKHKKSKESLCKKALIQGGKFMFWYNKSVNECINELGSDAENGLSSKKAISVLFRVVLL